MAINEIHREHVDGVLSTPGTIHRNTQEARQGETTGRIRTVLAISLVVAALAMIIVFLVWKSMHS